MSILDRFSDIVKSNINALLDKAENPSKMIDQYLRDLTKSLAEVKRETAGVMAEETRAKRVLDENNAEIEKYENLAKKALQAGNESYLSGTATMNVSESLRTDLATNGQKPHTVVITCSDSRVPPELLFNSGLGELFVIRTAGNVVDEFEIGSVEYAADHLGSPLVLVMGHSHCGAVGAAVEGHAEGNIESIVEEITPSVEKAKEEATSEDEITTKAEDLNVENSIKNLRESEILKGLEDSGKIKIVGAKYDIDTGKVTFFDNTNK